MSQLPIDQNRLANTDADSGYDPIPAGKYIAHIVESEMKDTKAGTGQYLSLSYEVLDGPYKGRRIFQNLNLVNTNDKAVDIAYQHLAALTDVLGVGRQLADSQALHGKPLLITVKVKTDAQYGDKNEVKGYATAQGSAAPAPQAVAGGAAPGFTGNSRPWESPK